MVQGSREDSFRLFFLALNLRTFHKLAHLLFVHQRLVRLLLSSSNGSGIPLTMRVAAGGPLPICHGNRTIHYSKNRDSFPHRSIMIYDNVIDHTDLYLLRTFFPILLFLYFTCPIKEISCQLFQKH
jgi:hypothetical protein